MISIITVNWNSYDFLNILIESLEIFSTVPYELIVVDNSIVKEPIIERENVHVFPMVNNIGHGRGLNNGIYQNSKLFPKQPFIMFLDVDCHILCHKWEIPFIGMMKKFPVIGGRGVLQKPIRPACMFMKREVAESYDFRDTTNYQGHRVTPTGYDVAILAYKKMMADGHDIGFLEAKENRYDTLNGEEWCINDIPLVYHHWHGSHLKEREEMDFPDDDLMADKEKLFQQIPWRII
jgi:glycosyltransferase involved in cell wall biosynthesis